MHTMLEVAASEWSSGLSYLVYRSSAGTIVQYQTCRSEQSTTAGCAKRRAEVGSSPHEHAAEGSQWALINPANMLVNS